MFVCRLVKTISVVMLATAMSTSTVQADTLSPINLTAQATGLTAPPQFIPTDVTPFTVTPERNKLALAINFDYFKRCPKNYGSTALLKHRNASIQMCFLPTANQKQIMPSLTVGYELFKNTSIYANYFVIKDVFARDYFNISFPTTQSISMGIRHTKQLGRKTSLQFDFQARELWQTAHLHQFDFLPNITLSHVFNPRHIIYGSTLLQLRGGDYFVAPTREIDPFYTVGYIYRHGLWTFVAQDTLVTNFRHPPFNDAIPNQSNVTMIASMELNRPLVKNFPGF